ncbi:Phosphate acetyltransferase (Phosphotransacetylase) [Bombilactobacillus mellis]|uniref:Phosphate acetyltransferase n=1 Tax=Bombilactobacillus mellis TaxID=1218508 RepID=A0A0F4KU30_9LACO|nr:phosphate acetyltransferase [Bombilactobacillus mellis]MBI0107436.1 phosphate acetyltransferase [Lactobacillus sp. W8086]MBI0108902.1 phosphate acetyltransferase [Lactobacillus sp. W8085]MBI0112118.1 phosphate acetyltransferase [Lactobacillus sp. W8088]MBI0115834.1 phosphate acetyltransferase [Lactobacillus sp. W8087]MBI0119558.1 phosphate acetyltransferase [Lactobacillus sp. W8089]MBI0131524.1 phosphate acetyltransferase [Lactobacillus sp. W8090]
MELFESLKQKIKGKNLRIVFPEATDERILKAAVRLQQENLVEPVFLGAAEEIQKAALAAGVTTSQIKILDPNNYSDFEQMVDAFVERRHGKNTKEQAQKMLRDPNYFGTMLVFLGQVDGMVSGAVHPTGDTVRPALQIIKVKPGLTRTSGAFIMQKDDQRYLFADCAININPNSQELAEIAVTSAKTAQLFDIDPKVALLSFSTKGSAKSDEVTKVAEAAKLAQQMDPDLALDGELQFDAAFVPKVAQQKAPNSAVAGQATVFVFPELQSGNIGYKIAQRFGGFEAIGPVLQGLNKPVSDLSRGCNEEDVYKLSLITAAQAL